LEFVPQVIGSEQRPISACFVLRLWGKSPKDFPESAAIDNFAGSKITTDGSGSCSEKQAFLFPMLGRFPMMTSCFRGVPESGSNWRESGAKKGKGKNRF